MVLAAIQSAARGHTWITTTNRNDGPRQTTPNPRDDLPNHHAEESSNPHHTPRLSLIRLARRKDASAAIALRSGLLSSPHPFGPATTRGLVCRVLCADAGVIASYPSIEARTASKTIASAASKRSTPLPSVIDWRQDRSLNSHW